MDLLAPLIEQKQAFLADPKGNYKKYLAVVDRLPDPAPSVIRLDNPPLICQTTSVSGCKPFFYS
jgi:tRNA (mo5U34)-methyltransferase